MKHFQHQVVTSKIPDLSNQLWETMQEIGWELVTVISVPSQFGDPPLYNFYFKREVNQ